MSHHLSDNQDHFDELWHTATYAYKMTAHSSTGYCTSKLTLSRSKQSHIVKTDIEYEMQSSEMTKPLYRQKTLADCDKIGQAENKNWTKHSNGVGKVMMSCQTSK
jgi:hypothetical protein